jgi:GNAT superfamily N-acetyltransferase
MQVLRPHIAAPEAFADRVDKQQRPEGYRLVGSFGGGGEGAAGGARVVAATGFRRLHNLAWGDLLYIDDLVTMESHRGRGHAHRLLEWVVAEARRLGCAQVHLDSAPHRHAAHRLYLTEGYHISSFHFSREV